MKNIPTLRFPEFENDGEWEEKKLGDIAELTSSKRVHLSDYVPSGVPFFRGKEISLLKNNQIPNDILYISQEHYNEIKERYGVPEIGDILITAVGTLGNVYCVQDSNMFYFKDGNLIWMRSISEDSRFLEILLNVKNEAILSSAIGSSQKALTMVALNKLKFAFPKRKEQQKIADCLSSVDGLISAQSQKVELLKEHKKGLMQQLFPSNHPALSGTPPKEGNVPKLRFPEFVNDGEWEEKALGKIAEIIMGQSPDSNTYNTTQDGQPLIQGNADIFNRKTNPRIWTSEPTKECQDGDIILTVRAPVGAVAKSFHNACIGRGVCAIQPKESNEFLYQFLLTQEDRWDKLSQGSTFTAINSNDIRSFILKIPQPKEQQKIADCLNSIDEQISQQTSKLQTLKEHKKALMQQLFPSNHPALSGTPPTEGNSKDENVGDNSQNSPSLKGWQTKSDGVVKSKTTQEDKHA